MTAARPSGFQPRLFITGATGFLGGHVLAACDRAGWLDHAQVLVRSVDAWQQTPLARRFPQIRAVAGHLLDVERWQGEVTPFDRLVHLAAVVRHSRFDVDDVWRVNVEGTRNMVALAAAQGARVVFVSSSGTVACSRRLEDAPNEDAAFATRMVGRWPYYASKIQAEQAAQYLAQQNRLALTILRPPAMYGPDDPRGRATGLIRQFLGGKLPFRLAGGINACDVRDVAQAIVAALRRESPRPVYHLPGHAESLASFFTRLSRLSGQPAPRITAPYALAWPLAWASTALGRKLTGQPLPPRIDPVVIEMGRHHWNVSSKYVEGELGYVPRPLDDTLKDTLQSLSHDRA